MNRKIAKFAALWLLCTLVVWVVKAEIAVLDTEEQMYRAQDEARMRAHLAKMERADRFERNVTIAITGGCLALAGFFIVWGIHL